MQANRLNQDFLKDLIERCRKAKGRLAFPESLDRRMLEAAARILAYGTASDILLFTPKTETLALAKSSGIDLERYQQQLRWSEEAYPHLEGSVLFQAAQLLKDGEIDTVLAGNFATTADVIRAGIKGLGLAPGVKTVSGSLFMNKPGGPLYLFADVGVVIAPTLPQLVDIAIESVRTWRKIVPQVEPVVAFLSYSTKGSAVHETSKVVAEAAAIFAKEYPDVLSDGEIQFDAAVDAAIGARKAPGSSITGRANCFIFPNLSAGNIAYKITQRLAGFEAYGPILQGLAKPFSDLSRGSTVDDIVASAHINLLRR